MSTVEFGLLPQKKKIGSIPLSGWSHSSAPACANIEQPRAGAVKACPREGGEWPLLSGHPQGLFLTAASTAAS